ncbi:MAG TPA: TonB-dependent receptor [Rhodoferax sp.]
MKSFVFSVCQRVPVRLAASTLAILAAFPVLAQSQVAGTLQEVVVTATGFNEYASALPYGVSVITQADIQQAGATTVNEALIKILGIPGRQDFYGGGDYGLDLHGFGTTASSNQVVIVDGIKLNDADLNNTRLAGIAIDTVAKIEVIRGSGSVLYGEGATGGVIVITTQAGRGTQRHNQADVYTAVGSYGLREARANATLASGEFSLDVSGNSRQADNYRDNFKSRTDGGTLHAQWSNDWLRLGGSYAHDALDTGLPGSLTAAQYQMNPSQTMAPNDNAAIDNSRQTLFVQAEVGSWQLGLDLGQRSKSLDSVFSSYPYKYDVDANTLALHARNDARWGQTRNALTLGHDLNDWRRTVPGAYGSVSEQNSGANYVQDDLTLASGTRISLGYRAENIELSDRAAVINMNKLQTAWELGLTQHLSKIWSVFGRLGTSYRLANVDEMGFTTPGTVLQPQTSRDAEVGSRWNYDSGRVELRYYHNSLTHEIGYDPNAVGPYSPYSNGANVNFDPTRRQGVEVEAQHKLNQSLAFKANLGLRQATFTAGMYNGKTVPLVARSTLALRADWQVAPSQSLDAGVVFVSSQYVDFNNVCKVPGYAMTDARYAYQMRNIELSLGVSNLLDAKYYTQAYKCEAGVTNGIYPEAGRAVTAALRVKF